MAQVATPQRTGLIAAVVSLTVLAAAVAQLPAFLALTVQDPDAWIVNGLAWTAIGVVWTSAVVRSTQTAERSWPLPSALFRSGLGIGAAVIVVARAASIARRGIEPAIVVSSLESFLYELGVVSLASLAAFAISRSLLRPALVGTRPPLGTRDIALRTRVLVATMGSSFATAGILLNVLLDFDATPAPRLASYLATAAGLVLASAAIGWLVGEDTARGIDDVTRRMRELAQSDHAATGVPLVAADEIGDLVIAANELEGHIRRQEAERAATSERERIARELHDGVAKSVSVLSLDLAALASRAPADMRPSLGRVGDLARMLSEELRAIVLAFRTRPDQQPFAEALERAARTHGADSVQIEGDVERLGGLARFEVLRVVEEAVRNASEHAQATRIGARLRVAEDGLHLTVEDDGCGMSPIPWSELARGGHFGLLGMRERAELLDGELRIESAPEGGTRVTLEVPLPA